MHDIISVISSVDETMAKFHRGLISLDTVCEIFEDEWTHNLYALMRDVRGMKEA